MATPLPPEVLPPDYEALGSIGGLLTPREDYIPNLQSVYGDIVQNAADYQYFTAPLSNQGRTTASYGTGNNLVVAPDTPVRLVNNATGEVVYSGVGYEGAQTAIDAANALSASTGKKANWDIQVAGPTMQGFQSVSTDRPDVSTLGIISDIALPVAGSLLLGPLGAAAGSAVSGAAQGRPIGDIAKSALISGVGSAIGGQLFPGSSGAPTDVAASATQAGAQAATQAATQAAINQAANEIIVNAILPNIGSTVGSAFGSALTGVVPSFFDSAQLNNTYTQQTQARPPFADEIIVTGQLPTGPSIPGSALGGLAGGASLIPSGTTAPVGDEIVVTAKQQPDLNLGGSIGAITGATAPTTQPSMTTGEDIVVTGKGTSTLLPSVGAALGTAIGATAIPGGATTSTTGTTGDTSKGVLGTGLSTTEALGIAGLLGGLLGGGGGTGTTTTTPYTSPFGAFGGLGGMGLGTGMDYRANPNIMDYERYGFGPEASFFRPEYNRLVSTGASMGSAPAQQQQYTPLI